MNKLIGGFVFSLLVILMFATIDLWRFTAVKDFFVFILAGVFAIGSYLIGERIVGWFEYNDTTRGDK